MLNPPVLHQEAMSGDEVKAKYNHPSEVLELLQLHGIRTGFVEEGYEWDGEVMAINVPTDILIHNVAHWLVSPPERRKLPEFGLGSPPEDNRYFKMKEIGLLEGMTYALAESEEDLAGYLSTLFRRFFALGPNNLAMCQDTRFRWLHSAGLVAIEEAPSGKVSCYTTGRYNCDHCGGRTKAPVLTLKALGLG